MLNPCSTITSQLLIISDCIAHQASLFLYSCIKGEPSIEEYYEMYSEAEKYNNQITEAVMLSSSALQFLTQGRVVVVKSQSVSSHISISRYRLYVS